MVSPGPISLPLSYALVNDDLYWSNLSVNGRVVDGAPPTNHPWAPATPSTPAVIASGSGFLYSGRYLVTCTYALPDGREGGAPAPAVVDVTGNQAIVVTLPPPAQAAVTHIRVYVSDPNGEQMYHAGTYDVGTLSATILRAHRGRLLETLLMSPLPPGSLLAHLDGRLFSIRGRVAFFSEPFRFGLTREGANFVAFPADVRVFLPCVDGYWAVTDRVQWLNHRDPKQAEAITRASETAVPGTGVVLPHDQGVAWFGDRGWVVGKPGGQIDMSMAAKTAVDKYAIGSALFREQRGIRQVVSSLRRGTLQTKFAATDYMDAEIIRRAS